MSDTLPALPEDRQADYRRARRLEYLTIAYLVSAITFMAAVFTASQAMKTVWFEDLLGLAPPILFLLGNRFSGRPADARFPFGRLRLVSIAFLAAAVALLSMGGYLLVDAAITLVEAEHPTIGGVAVFGQVVWLGWMMLLPLLWSTLPSVFLARAKLPLADRLHDKILLADAEMAKADWMTGAAAMLGLGGLALGYWWADAAAGALISLDILRDGCRYVATAAHDLMDRRPQRLLDLAPDPLPEQLARTLEELDWVEAAAVRLREDGHLFSGEAFVVPRDDRDLIERINAAAKQACASDWRLRELVITPVRHLPPWA